LRSRTSLLKTWILAELKSQMPKGGIALTITYFANTLDG